MLQWGRGLKTAEIWRASLEWVMKPTLQWGRGLKTAEIWRASLEWVMKPTLQWGRGLKTAEMQRVRQGTRPIACASMGPRSEDRGNSTTQFA